MPTTPTHLAEIVVGPSLLLGEHCTLAISVAEPDITHEGDHESVRYLGSNDVVYSAVLPSAPLPPVELRNRAARLIRHHPHACTGCAYEDVHKHLADATTTTRDRAIAEADATLTAYGWRRIGDWTVYPRRTGDRFEFDILYAELIPATGMRAITLVEVPAGQDPLPGVDISDREAPLIVGLMTHPRAQDFLRASGWRMPDSGNHVYALTTGNRPEGYPTLTITLPDVPMQGRQLEQLGDGWLDIDWGVGAWASNPDDEHVTVADEGRLILLTVTEPTQVDVPQKPGNPVTVPPGGYIVAEYGDDTARWIEISQHPIAEAIALFTQHGGYTCPHCGTPLFVAPAFASLHVLHGDHQ